MLSLLFYLYKTKAGRTIGSFYRTDEASKKVHAIYIRPGMEKDKTHSIIAVFLSLLSGALSVSFTSTST